MSRSQAEELYWLRYDLTTELCAIAPYNRFFGPGDKRNYSINKVGEIAEKIARAILKHWGPKKGR